MLGLLYGLNSLTAYTDFLFFFFWFIAVMFFSPTFICFTAEETARRCGATVKSYTTTDRIQSLLRKAE